MSKITEVAELVEKGKAKLVGAAVQSALDEGCEATEILNSMIDAMAVVGERFKNGEIFVPEMLVAALSLIHIYRRSDTGKQRQRSAAGSYVEYALTCFSS